MQQTAIDITRADQTRFSALVFYAPDAGPGRPVVCFGHGFLSPPSLYTVTLRHLASWGYLVVAPQSALELFPDHDAYARDLVSAIEEVRRASASPWHLLYGLASPDSEAVVGHSMGGGAAILSTRYGRPDAVVTLAAAETRPSAIRAAADIATSTGFDGTAMLFITGRRDTITPSPRHTQPMFEAMNIARAWADIRGGSHCGFVGFPLPDAVCDDALIPLAWQLNRTHRLLTAFLEFRFQASAEAWDDMWGAGAVMDPLLTWRYARGVEVEPPSTVIEARVGETVEYSFTLRTTGTVGDTYRIELESNAEILTRLPASVTPGGPVGFRIRAVKSSVVRDYILIRFIPDGAAADGEPALSTGGTWHRTELVLIGDR